MRRVLRLLWRMPLAYALWLALPLQIVAGAVAYEGWAARARFAAHFGDAMPPFDLDQFRYFARWELRKNFTRLLAPAPPEDDGLETISLAIDREALAELNADLPRSGDDYKNAVLQIGRESMRVRARYMGDNHWHWLYPQKSWRIKTRKADPLRDRLSFNLKNAPTKLGIDETVTCEIAAEIGLLAPEVRPVKLLLNGVYAGLYLWWDVADESLLRRARRMPGSIYSGDGAPQDARGLSLLWYDQRYWTKAASRNADQELDRSDITELIEAIGREPVEFHAFAERHLDLDRFAKFVAMDRALGGLHHDYHHNHKLYFDPYRARWEPIQWDFNVWHLDRFSPGLDNALHPLLIALRRHPVYEHAFQAALHGLLGAELHPDAFARRLHRWVDAVLPALAADGHRDARDWGQTAHLRLPHAHCVTFTMKKYRGWVREAEAAYRRRWTRLQEALQGADLSWVTSRPAPGAPVTLDLLAGGTPASAWTGLAVRAGAGRVSLHADTDLDGRLGAGDRLVATAEVRGGAASFTLDERLYPGLTLVPHRSAYPVLFGLHDLEPTTLRYRYFVTGDGELDVAALQAHNAVTGRALEPTRFEAPARAPEPFSCHPWRLPAPGAPTTVRLGPGELVVDDSREFASHVTVEIAAGTTLRLGPGVSLWFFGPVRAAGTADAPVRFVASDPAAPWGVVALHGPGTAGSRLAHCQWADGSAAQRGPLRLSGMVSVLDTSDIRFESCRVGRNFVGDDALHWGYVRGGAIADCSFAGARSDAVDLDVCEDVVVEGCTFEDSGNDLLDLMTCRVAVRGCTFRGGGDKGISVGEASVLDLRDSHFARCSIGLEIKDASLVRMGQGVQLRDCGIGVNLYRKNTRYGKGGTLEAARIDYAGSGEALAQDRRSQVRLVGTSTADPGSG